MDTKLKPHLKKSELNHFRQLLIKKRQQALQQIDQLTDNIANLDEADDADFSSISHHPGDVGSDTEEQELNYQLRERATTFIKQIDAALERIENGTYGICQATGKPISRQRLEIVPHTRYSIEGLTKNKV